MTSPTDTFDELRAVREALRHTWHAFYARFGNLREAQRLAVAPVLAGHDTLVGAPTASGKTEALMAPLAQRLLSRRDAPAGQARLLVISPTRALCNDLHRRIEPPLRQCKLKVGVRTGDHSLNITRDAPPVVITTPESLDSMLSRWPAALRSVEALLLDEIHLLDGSARGDQLRVLLERLERICHTRPQRCAASATLPHADEIARRYLRAPELILVGGAGRGLDARLVHTPELADASTDIAETFLSGESRKILVFANARAQVEALVACLSAHPRLAGRIFAHHGSLSRSVRLRTERRFLDAPAAICVATMTLELGIDIGDVDRVVLVGPPPNVGALVQRVGRANRRGSVAHVTCLASDDFEALRLEHLLVCADEGRLFEDPVPFRPSVLAQQAISLLFQSRNKWIGAEVLHQRLPETIQSTYSPHDLLDLLQAMCTAGYLTPLNGQRFAAGDRAQKMYEHGLMHANIDDTPEIEVFDETTGELLGRVALSRKQRESLGDGQELGLSLAGRRREVVRITQDQVFVDSAQGEAPSAFFARQSPRYAFGLARDLAAFLGIGHHELRVERWTKGARLGHFLGTRWGLLLDGILRERGLATRPGNAFFHILKRDPELKDGFDDAERLERDARAFIARESERLARRLDIGPFYNGLPPNLLRSWLDEALAPAEFARHLAQCEWVEGPIFPLSPED
ncbi:DEAD/DEAH box helicase [Lujinxingia sediminis]|uniref:DEAD/DEAH box helicase n=1 Tax=Lujinxingia sediminis TaxID=2480984 RepID=A0ABY0CT38_9DELT|nr:DEAD/DEAH box helicase [Lujinxingia sediminis]RVU44768.1 DEAD/DEAH box helicase [Lujinxingia sediminis]